MQLGIIGLSSAGKSTVFNLMAEKQSTDNNKQKTLSATARIPDARIDFLSGFYHPKKTTYAQIEIIDVPSLIPSSSASYVFLDAIRQSDALLYVLKAFKNKTINNDNDDVSPLQDLNSLNYELLLADLDLIEKRIDRINKNKKKSQLTDELTLLETLKKCLEQEAPLSSLNLSADEHSMLVNYNLLTLKPALICVNISEDDITERHYPDRDKLIAETMDRNVGVVELSAAIEQELALLEGDDKQMFMEELGIAESGISLIARKIYESLHLISFFTVGEDEVKAWTVLKGIFARAAAGKIHSDIERGFIKAEVISYANFYEHKSLAVLREKGLLKLEGKEYVVNDGDIIHFRFNV
ncbi:MAG: redox-regulated ATPase YchF [Syntrophomonadaceae bacterium]|jgi:GTP-binding protein YchF|nr:redox-regulated ATPase YchF [Syntrophomonadaceae bacterium]